MIAQSEYVKKFFDKIEGYEGESRRVLIDTFDNMMQTIKPLYVSKGVKYYTDIPFSELVERTENAVVFRGFNVYPEKQDVVISEVGDKIYQATYKIRVCGAEEGWFRTDIKRLPEDYNDRKFVGLDYQGFYTRNPFVLRNMDVAKELSKATEQGILEGKPVSIYKSHSWITMGRVDDKMMCGNIIGVLGENVDFNSFGIESNKAEKKEMLDMLYLGNVPNNNVLTMVQEDKEMGE